MTNTKRIIEEAEQWITKQWHGRISRMINRLTDNYVGTERQQTNTNGRSLRKVVSVARMAIKHLNNEELRGRFFVDYDNVRDRQIIKTLVRKRAGQDKLRRMHFQHRLVRSDGQTRLRGYAGTEPIRRRPNQNAINTLDRGNGAIRGASANRVIFDDIWHSSAPANATSESLDLTNLCSEILQDRNEYVSTLDLRGYFGDTDTALLEALRTHEAQSGRRPREIQMPSHLVDRLMRSICLETDMFSRNYDWRYRGIPIVVDSFDYHDSRILIRS